MSKVEQTFATRNQSTAQISENRQIFIFDNRFKEEIFKNGTLASVSLKAGQLVVRNGANVSLATDSNLEDVVGITAYEGESTLEANGTKNINICTKGTIDGTALSLPENVTLETAVGNKTLSDVLEGLGFHIDTSTIENTKIEN